MTDRTIAVLAGGMGTRVASLTGGTIAKAMLEVGGRPFIDHKLDEVVRLGASRAVLLLGAHSEAIVAHVGDGERWGLSVVYVTDDDGLNGTGGALRRAGAVLPEHYWVTYGDSLLDVDVAAAERAAENRRWRGVMTVLENEDRWQPSNVAVVDERVAAYDKERRGHDFRYIDYGYLYLPNDAVMSIAKDRFDLSEVLHPLIERGTLGAFKATEPFHDIGTPEAWAATDEWLRARNR
jgi:NDP-sugar pyrophosphorylase family protein